MPVPTKMREQNSQVCYPNKIYVLSENQVLSEFYNEVVAALLKGYITLQMSYMIQTANFFSMYLFRIHHLIINYIFKFFFSWMQNKANYRDRAEKLRENFAKNVTLMQDDIKLEIRNASRAMWACDPDDYVAQGLKESFFGD